MAGSPVGIRCTFDVGNAGEGCRDEVVRNQDGQEGRLQGAIFVHSLLETDQAWP